MEAVPPPRRSAFDLFPPLESYRHGWLAVSELHELYFEESGNKDGNPVVVLHGGPGSGTKPSYRRFFDPEAYRIVMFDQRGAGKSRPSAELRDNTTWDLVEDMERLREHLGISRWVVFGGSWGSTLALAYAQKHPGAVKAMVLRGIFTLRREEIEWFYQEGASALYPEPWEDYLAPIPKAERRDLVSAYYRRLTSDNKETQLECAKAWAGWELHTSKLIADPAVIEARLADREWALSFARIECHYFVHGGWLEEDDYLLANVDHIRHIPATIVQGRYDLVTPMKTAWQLHKNWPEAEFYVVPDAGHSHSEAGTEKRLVQATEKYKNL